MAQKGKKEMIRSPKGMHDMLPNDLRYIRHLSEVLREIATYHGFGEIQTPHLEQAELFIRPLGEASDVVQKEMYTLRTKGGDLLALRPEATAPIMRAYIEHGMGSWPQPVKLFCEGAFFRHENPQRGRFREFRQFDLEVLGEQDPVMDALIIKIFYQAFKELGFKNILIHVNSIGNKECRPIHRKELTNYFKKRQNYLCKDCKRRLKENPLRILDCKVPGCVELRSQAPQMIDYLCDGCKVHLKGVLEFLDESKIPYAFDNFLVRGFDYYSRTVFEIFLEEDEVVPPKEIKVDVAKEVNQPAEPVKAEEEEKVEKSNGVALAGGGRYDDLMVLLGQRALPAVGGAIGIERVVHEMKRLNLGPKAEVGPKVYVIQIGLAAKRRSFLLLDELRDAGIRADASLSRDSLKTQLNIAAKVGARISLIIGQKEAMDGSVIMRDMDEGTQETVLQSKLVEKLKVVLKTKK
jgi:histidyl-tRNA synthetase